ncbi:MAG: hypothetical protein O7A09_09375 [Proteobacteria bacterium]|nr:hypothetical protein [Pseudomonadota bacterium]
MGRTRLRGIELAGIRVAVEVPPNSSWDWADTPHHRFECSPLDPDLYIGVRRGVPDLPRTDFVVYACDGSTFEVGRHGTDWVVVIHGPGHSERIARFDASFREGEVWIRPDVAESLAHPLVHPLDEIIVLHRIAREGGLMLRGSAVLREGRALVFVGDTERSEDRAPISGWRQIGAPSLSGGRVVLRVQGRDVWLFGAPWQSDAAFALPIRARLDAVHSIRESPAVCAERLYADAATSELLAHVFAPVHDPDGAARLHGVAERVAERVPVVSLGLPEEQRVVPFTWGQRHAALAFAPPFLT